MKHLSLKTKNIIVTSTVCAVAVVTGIGLGAYFGQEMFGAAPSFSADDPLAYEDDNAKIFKKYEKGSISPADLEPWEMINLATHIYESTPNHYYKLHGECDAGIIMQYVDTIAGSVDGKGFMESISASSMVSVAKRFYQDGENIVEYDGSSIDSKNLTAKWGDEIQFNSIADFELKWGKDVNRSSIYIISSKTVIGTPTKVQDSNGNWTIDIELDPNTSTLRYARQIVNMSGLKKLPVFYWVKLQYKIDKDMNIISRTINENYDVNKIGVHNTQGVLVETYHVNEGFKIPDLNTNCDYGGK